MSHALDTTSQNILYVVGSLVYFDSSDLVKSKTALIGSLLQK